MSHRNDVPAPAEPWWKFGHVWMIVAGPALVVVAGFVTLYLAVHRPDPLVTDDYYQKGLALSKAVPDRPAHLTPALQARNHAATGGAAPLSPPAPRR